MKLKIINLQKNFESKEVLKDITFTFETGKIYGLLGKNGAGKTTLFNCIDEDLPIDSGSFVIEEDGAERNASPDDIGYVLSTPAVPEFLTGREFLKFFLDINGSKIKEPKTLSLIHIYTLADTDEARLVHHIVDIIFDLNCKERY